MGDDVRPELSQESRDQRCIANVAADEPIAWVVLDFAKRFEHARIGQLVEVQDLVPTIVDKMPDERGSNESRSPRD
jgi:hypothetical protein